MFLIRLRNFYFRNQTSVKVWIFILLLLCLSWYIPDSENSDFESPVVVFTDQSSIEQKLALEAISLPSSCSSENDISSTLKDLSYYLPENPVLCHAGPFDKPIAKTSLVAISNNITFSRAYFFSSKPYAVDFYDINSYNTTTDHPQINKLMEYMRPKADKVEMIEIFVGQMPHRQCDLLVVGGTNYQTLSRQLLRLRKSCHYNTKILLLQLSDRPLDLDPSLSRVLKDRYSLDTPVCPTNCKFCLMKYHASNFIEKPEERLASRIKSNLHEFVTFDDFEHNITRLQSRTCDLNAGKSSILSSIEKHAYDYGGYILLSPTNKDFFDMTHASDCSLRSVGIHSILYMAFDHLSLPQLEKLNRERKEQGYPTIVYFKSQLSSTPRSDLTLYKHQAFVKLMWERFQVQRSLLELGIDVLISDSDIIHMQNPFKSFRKDMAEQGSISSPSSDSEDDFDMVIQLDLKKVHDYSRFPEPPEGCGGYFYLRSTLASMRMLDQMLKLYIEHPTKRNHRGQRLDDQDILNAVLKTDQACAYNVGPRPLSCDHQKFRKAKNFPRGFKADQETEIPHIGWKFHYLKQARFINGHLHKELWDISKRTRTYPTMIHANGQETRKQALFESYGIWPLENGKCVPAKVTQTKLKWTEKQ